MPTVTGRATDFITFSRPGATGGGATVTDRDGRIRWAGHNLLTNSESFDASAWGKASNIVAAPVVTANNVAAPNGTITADKIAFPAVSGANANSLIFQSPTQTLSTLHTASVYLRGDVGGEVVWLAWTSDGVTYSRTQCTLTTSWQLFTLSYTTGSSGTQYIQIGIDLRDGSQSAKSAQTIYAWGAHLYRSDLGGMVLNPARGDAYYPTTPRNLLGFTESLTTGWTNTNTTDSIVTETNPNGLASSVEVTATSANGTLLGSLSLLASPYTFSIWLKRKTGTGTVEITVDGTTYVTAAVTGTWTRFSTTLTPSAGTRTPGIRLVTSGDAVYAWGAQLSDSASLDAYSPVYGAAVTSAAYYAPRLDFDPVTLAARGLLVEELRTNLVLRSNEFNTAWVAAGTTVTANTTAVTAPDGTTTADKLVETATTGSHSITQQITSVIGRVYTASVYAKAAERTIVAVRIDNLANSFAWFNLATGVIGTKQSGVTATITDAGGGWYRCSVTGTATATNHGLEVYIADADNSTSYAGDITKGVYLYGAQLEDNAPFATSYIPTGAAQATRTADVASVSTQAFPYSASASSLVVSATALANQYSNVLELSASASAFGLLVYHNLGSISAYVDASSVSLGSATAGTVQKIGIAYDGSANGAVRNGGTVSSVGTTVSAAANKLGIGSSFSGGSTFNGHIRQITYVPRRLSNAELQSRTA